MNKRKPGRQHQGEGRAISSGRFAQATIAEFSGGPYDGQRRELGANCYSWACESMIGPGPKYLYYRTFYPTPDGLALYWVWAANHEES